MLEGDLEEFTLPDILKLLAFTTKTGRLGIVTDAGRGRVDLVQGRVRDASADADHLPLARRLLGRRLLDGPALQALLDDAEALPTDLQLARRLVARDEGSAEAVGEVLREQALDAVFDLLRWNAGTFRFETTGSSEGSDVAPVLELSVDEALEDATRRLGAWAEILERTGPGDAVVNVGRPSQTSVEVDADGWQLLGLADGRRTIDELSVLCGRGQFDTRRTLSALLELGVVSVATDGAAGGEDRLLADQALLSQLEASLTGRAVVQPRQTHAPAAAQMPAAAPVSLQARLTAEVHDFATAAVPARTGGELVGASRANSRSDRMKQDPSIDADLINRLITGVEGL